MAEYYTAVKMIGNYSYRQEHDGYYIILRWGKKQVEKIENVEYVCKA